MSIGDEIARLEEAVKKLEQARTQIGTEGGLNLRQTRQAFDRAAIGSLSQDLAYARQEAERSHNSTVQTIQTITQTITKINNYIVLLRSGQTTGTTTASHVSENPSFDQAIIDRNTAFLRQWAANRGWSRRPGGGPETWGVIDESGAFSWRLKIKAEASTRPGLGVDSARPRVSARLDATGKTYVNPFTGKIVSKVEGTHVPLSQPWML